MHCELYIDFIEKSKSPTTHPHHILQGHHWECADQLHHCLVRELQCCWPQDPPADSEHGCKDHRCPSPIHPRHFPCTMLQQNQQHREGPHPPLPQSLPAPTIRKTVPEHQSPLCQTAQQLFPPGCESPELRSPRPPLKPHANPTSWNMDPPPSPKHPPTLPHHRKKLWTFFVQFKCAKHRWVGLYKPLVVTHSPLCTRPVVLNLFFHRAALWSKCRSHGPHACHLHITSPIQNQPDYNIIYSLNIMISKRLHLLK